MRRPISALLLMVTLFFVLFSLGTRASSADPFVDNQDGTIADTKTGLVWQKGDSQNFHVESDNCTGECPLVYTLRNWREAMDYCAGLELAGQGNWRLPTRTEIMSLVDYGIQYAGVTIDTRYFPDCRPDYYWSSSTHAHLPAHAWGLYFFNGYVIAYYKDNKHYVRCVRGGS